MRYSAAVGLFGLLVHFAYFLDSHDDPTFAEPLVDAAEYADLARRIVDHGLTSITPFFRPPLYPLFVAAIFRWAGPSAVAVKAVQTILGALTGALTCLLGCRVFSNRVGLVAGLLLAVYGPFVFFNAQYFPAGLATLLDVLALLLLVRAARAPRDANWIFVGIATGLSALTIPNALVLFGAAALAAVSQRFRKSACSGTARQIALTLIGTALAIAPVTWMNYRASGEWIPISTHGGINFYLGNNEDTWHTLRIRPGLDWEYLQKTPLRDGVGTEAQASAYFTRKALHYIRSHPGAFMWGLLTKARHFLASRELPRTFDIYEHRRYSRLLALLVWKIGPVGFPFAIAAPFAFLGMLVACRRHPESRPLAAFFWLYGSTLILFFVCARYRVVLAPVLLLFAAQGGFSLAEQARRPKRLLAATMFLLGIAVFTSLPVRAPLDGFNFPAEMHTLIGLRAAERGDLAAAEREYRRALELDSGFARAYHALGTLRARQGRLQDALEAFANASQADPALAEAHSDLASVLLTLGRDDEAICHLQKALQTKPYLAAAHDMLGLVLLRRGDTAGALSSFQRAMESDPTRFEPPAQMAWLLATHPAPHLRDGQRAIALAERSLQLAADKKAQVLDILAAAQAECGRYGQACETAQRALDLGRGRQSPAWLAAVTGRLQRYSAGQPFRDHSLTNLAAPL